MSITLKIISYQHLTPNQQESFSSDLNRFSVGRGNNNHWALPDPQRFLSGTHCWLENRNGAWFITDTSTNGVFINKSDQRMNKNESIEIRDGDRIRIGDYEFEVHIQPGPAGHAGVGSEMPDFSANPFMEDSGDQEIDDIIGSPDTPSPARPRFSAWSPTAPVTNAVSGSSN